MIDRPRVRQLGLGELLDETFRIYRSGFVTFVAIAALIYVPYAILSFVIAIPLNQQVQRLQTAASTSATPDDPRFLFELFGGVLFSALGAIALSIFYSVVFDPLLQGALARSVSQRYLGRTMTVGDAFGTALRRAWPLIGSRLLTWLLGASLLVIGVAVYFLAIFSAVGMMVRSEGDFRYIGLFIAIGFLAFGLLVAGGILFIFVWTRLLFTLQAAAIEGHGAWDSVQRSWRLTSGYFWRTLGYLLVIVLLAFLVGFIPTMVITLPVQLLFPSSIVVQSTVSTIVSSLVAVIVTPFSLIAYTLMYYDLRVRKEAFDLEQRADLVLPSGAYDRPLGAP